jgi:hypothetical protein
LLRIAMVAGLLFNLPFTVIAEPNISYLDNQSIRIGINLDMGGAITFLADSKTKQNLVNSFDCGRQIQMSYYSGPVPFRLDGKEPKKEWIGIG